MMPPSSEQIAEYSGKFIEQIEQQVLQIEQQVVRAERADEIAADQMLTRDPLLILVGARTHLADREMKPGDPSAYFALGEKMDEVLAAEDQGQKLIRERLDLWMQGRAGCDD
ncbi:MAG: hypothetical protein JWQ87_2225 [Candidatus Sulfotelmatobacter sp.]|nr:hypothetical protein [Candidatus Sulfotelmatobacter sp.]